MTASQTIQTLAGSFPGLAASEFRGQQRVVAPVESLFAEERRCPRCGANLNNDRRELERREKLRRLNAADDPGPPPPEPERRVDERRKGKRRTNSADGSGRKGGWPAR